MSKSVQKSVIMACRTEFLHEVRRLMQDALAEANVPQRKRDLIVLAVDEAVSSIVAYARYKGYEHDVSLEIEIDDVRFKAVINDTLNIFDMNGGLTDEQVTARVSREKAFTMGIFLMRRIMDEITYTYKKGFENQLEMIYFL